MLNRDGDEILSLPLSALPFILWGYSYVCERFLLHHFISFGVGLAAYFSNHSPFLREHIFVDFNKFLFLVCWCTVIHHHRPILCPSACTGSQVQLTTPRLARLMDKIQSTPICDSFQVMAEDYELLLNKLLNSLRRCQDYVLETFQGADLSHLEMLVDL